MRFLGGKKQAKSRNLASFGAHLRVVLRTGQRPQLKSDVTGNDRQMKMNDLNRPISRDAGGWRIQASPTALSVSQYHQPWVTDPISNPEILRFLNHTARNEVPSPESKPSH
jgi:hypothetical protein